MPEPNTTCPCGATFYVPAWRVKRGDARYCSYTCRNRFRGVSPLTRARMSVSQQARGSRSADTKARMSKAWMGRPRTHGRTCYRNNTTLYVLWRNIKTRCFNPHDGSYEHYGGRGITMHAPWRTDYMRFETDLLAAIGPRLSPQHSIDRINNDGHYEPGNLRWATASQQNSNQRHRAAKG